MLACLRQNKTDMALVLLNNPAVDLDTVDSDGNHLEDLARSCLDLIQRLSLHDAFQGHATDPGPAVDLQECPTENDPP